MKAALDQLIRRRASYLCEYCQMLQFAYRFRFPIDHVVARQHGGKTVSSNLALACLRCNAHKGPNLAGMDPVTGKLTRLYHPRRDPWSKHFRWNGAKLRGRTAIGRITIQILSINHPEVIAVRRSLIKEGRFPP
jgi:5-methylcytosine-specific restriction endonuclease McrA